MWWIFAVAVIVIAAIPFVRAGVKIRYNDADGLTVKAVVCGICVKELYPGKVRPKKIRLRDFTPKAVRKREEAEKKQAAKKKKSAKKPKAAKKASAGASGAKKKRTFSDTLRLVRQITRIVKLLLGRFFGYIRADIKALEITVATGDAAQTALVYGAAAQGSAYLTEFLRTHADIRYSRKAVVGVAADFTGDQPSARIDITLSLSVGQAIKLLWSGLSAAREAGLLD